MKNYFAEIEVSSRKKIEDLQIKRINAAIKKAKKTKFYNEKLKKIHSINSLSELKNLPITFKDDLRNSYPYELVAVDLSEVKEIHASSGTTGNPTVVTYDSSDIEIWMEVMARTLYAQGVRPGDILQNAFGYGLFTGGLGVHYGGMKLGTATIPISGGQTEKQIQIMKDFKPVAITATPSYLMYITEVMEELKIDKNQINLKIAILGAEPWSEGMRKEIEHRLNIKAYDIYGLSEIIGPGVSFECEAKNGLHINEDYFIPEIVDSKTYLPVEDGNEGVLVLTSCKSSMPLIRYMTKDICSITHEKCSCGRTFARMSRVKGRTDDMLIIRGVNVYPSQIESILLKINEVTPNYQIIVDSDGVMDNLEVQIEIKDDSKSKKEKQKIGEMIKKKLKDFIGLTMHVTVVERNSIERSQGKAKRVIDRRKK